MDAKHYDYIFLGAGCASLSIIMRMISSNKFSHKKILLIDKEPKTKNDRTWCFWEKEPGFFENVVHHKWDHLLIKTAEGETISLKMGQYVYKMINGKDFYKNCFSLINLQDNIDIIYGEISFDDCVTNNFKININDKPIEHGKKTIIFNSIYIAPARQKNKLHLLQHFKGWIIETHNDLFNPGEATLMDFRVSQNNGTTFVYILPLSSRKALVEYTLFSNELLPTEEYNNGLKCYLDRFLKLTNYEIVEEEFGIIPMTNENFSFFKNGMYYIGTAGGQTKASTGYTFRFIQTQADKIVEDLIKTGEVAKHSNKKSRFFFYDSTLLHILSRKLLEGKAIFSTLFKKNHAYKVFKFLDNETTLSEEIKLLNSLPKKIFIKAGFREFIKMFFAGRKS